MDKWRIKKGDLVQVTTGKDKGKKGEIIQVVRDDRKVFVKGVNICVKHEKPSAGSPKGNIVRKERAIHASNVMLVDSTDDKPTRVGMKFVDGKKVRVSRRTGSVIS